MFLQEHSFEVRQILLSFETLDSLLLILLDSVHLGVDLTLLSLKFDPLLVLLSLTEVLIDTLVKVYVLQELVISMLSQDLTRKELLKDFALELFDYIFTVDRKDFLSCLLLRLLNLRFLCRVDFLTFLVLLLLFLLFCEGDEAFDLFKAVHGCDHLPEKLSSLDHVVYMLVDCLCFYIWVLHANFSQCMVGI